VTKRKAKEAAPVAAGAAPSEAQQNASQATSQADPSPAPELSGASPHLRAGIYERGRKAISKLEWDAKKRLTYDTWLSACEAVDAARKEALEEVGLTGSNLPHHRLGGGFNKVLSRILHREQLDSEIIDSKTRGEAFKIIEHRAAIEKWRRGLGPAKRASLNHPHSIWENFKKTLPKAPKQPKKTRNRVMPAEPKIESWAQPAGSKPSAKHIERAAERQAREAMRECQETETDPLEELRIERDMAMAMVESLKKQVANLMDPDEARLVALVRGGLKDEDLGDLTHEELMAFASRIRQLADEREGNGLARRRVN